MAPAYRGSNAVKFRTQRLMKTKTTFLAIQAAVAMTTHAAVTITTGNFDASATLQGAVRFRSINTSPSQKEVYLAASPSALGTAERSQTDLVWNSGATFSFGWDPVRNKIFTEVVTIVSGTKRLERSFSPPDSALMPNFILVSGKDTTPLNNLVLTMASLDGNLLARDLVASNSFSQISITDPDLMRDGFVLTGSIAYTGTPNSNESDKFEIAFGHSTLVPVPEPSTYLAAAMLAIPALVGLGRSMRARPY